MEYFSELTNNTYAVDQCAKTFNEAEAWCAGNFGGHLVSYYSLQEQLEVGWYSVQRSFCMISGVMYVAANALPGCVGASCVLRGRGIQSGFH